MQFFQNAYSRIVMGLKPKPTFIASNLTSTNQPSISKLPAALTINGTTVYPTARYEGKDASEADASWPAVYGETLVEAGSGDSPTYNQGVPLAEVDKAVEYNEAKYHEGPDNDYGDFGTKDVYCEFLVNASNDAAFTNFIINKYDGSNGYYIGATTSNSIIAVFYGADGAGNMNSGSIDVYDRWLFCQFYCDADGYAYMYVNGTETDSVNYSNFGDLDGATKLKFQGQRDAANIAYFALYTESDWFAGGSAGKDEIAAIMKKRFAALCGSKPQYSASDYYPSTNERDSAAILKMWRSGGYYELFKVGANWPRFEKLSNGMHGYLSEKQYENQMSDEVIDWAAVHTTISDSGIESPLQGLNWTKVQETDTIAKHSITATYDDTDVSDGDLIYVSALVKKGTWSTVYMMEYRNFAGIEYDLESGTITHEDPADVVSRGIDDLGDDVYRIWFTTTQDDANNGRFAGLYLYFKSSGYIDYQGDSSRYFYAALPQVVFDCPAPINPISVGATKDEDRLEYANSNDIIPDAGCVIEFDFIANSSIPAGVLVEAGDGSDTDRVTIELTSDGYIQADCNDSSSSQFTITGSADLRDGSAHSVKLRVKADDIELLVDSSSIGTDASATLPDIDQLQLGCSYSDGEESNGHISNLRISEL